MEKMISSWDPSFFSLKCFLIKNKTSGKRYLGTCSLDIYDFKKETFSGKITFLCFSSSRKMFAYERDKLKDNLFSLKHFNVKCKHFSASYVAANRNWNFHWLYITIISRFFSCIKNFLLDIDFSWSKFILNVNKSFEIFPFVTWKTFYKIKLVKVLKLISKETSF